MFGRLDLAALLQLPNLKSGVLVVVVVSRPMRGGTGIWELAFTGGRADIP